MAFSAPRLTIYALLSSVEEDLRSIIVELLAPATPREDLLGVDLVQSAIRRHADENGPSAASLATRDLLPYVDLGDLVDVLHRHRNALPLRIGTHIRSLANQLQLLLPIRKRIAHIRPFRYDDLARVTTFADQVSAEEPSIWTSVTETVAKLGHDPAFVFDLPLPRYEEAPNSAYHNLPLPEFDDTGFLGRDAEVGSVLALCKGPWPVISLVGEGGLGKTALALRCAYDLLDDDSNPFDAIIWSSSKTTRLDPTQIREIDGAIRDSFGLFEHIAHALGSNHPRSDARNRDQRDDAEILNDILEYLESFRVLLVLDNLETVLDSRIRGFLARLPMGSKILITSRIGIGEYENRMNVQPLPGPDASRLLRAFAKVSGVRSLSTMPEDRLIAMCGRMQNNPLFIKWFVSAVQTGLSPEESLVDPSLFLDFCMSNVYDYLSDSARGLLKVFLAAPGELSLPELIYFNDNESHESQAAVQELLTTNMLEMNSAPTDNERIVETRYHLSELARLYLTKHHPLSPDEDRNLERIRARLAEDEQRIQHQISGDRYEPRTIQTRAKSDLLVVKPLLDALRFTGVSDYASALACVEQAKHLAPDYFECFRVEAQVHATARNVAVADAGFRTAIGLAFESPALHYFYAQFLRTVRRDLDGAIEQLQEATGLDPTSPHVSMEMVRCQIEALGFSSARELLDALLLDPQLPKELANEVWRLNVDFFVAHANFAIQTKDYLAAIASLESLQREVEASPISRANAVQGRLVQSLGALWCCIRESQDEGIELRARTVLDWLTGIKRLRIPYTVPLSDSRSFGTVKFVDHSKDFGFINSTSDGEIFFHRDGLRDSSDFLLLKGGTPVSYRLAASARGRKATEIGVG